jgi:hypothetical protein
MKKSCFENLFLVINNYTINYVYMYYLEIHTISGIISYLGIYSGAFKQK